MSCQRCGQENDTQNTICTNCANDFEDKGGFKYGLIGFLFPAVAIIVYYMLKEKEPKLCRYMKIGAIISICLAIISFIFYIFYILSYIFIFINNLSGNLYGI